MQLTVGGLADLGYALPNVRYRGYSAHLKKPGGDD